MKQAERYGTVGVLMGGPSAEREISLKSGRAVAAALRQRGVKVVEIGEHTEIKAGVLARRIDVAFIALHGRFGEDGEVQSFLEERGIPYTGSGVEASRLALDKAASRRIFRKSGLPTPPSLVYDAGDRLAPPSFSFPVVIKPSLEGSSIGLTIVDSPDKFEAACALAREYDRKIIVEKYIPGEEVTVGVLEGEALPVIKIVPRNPFFDYEAKYTKGKSSFIIPAPLPLPLYREVQQAGLSAHRALGCYAYSRTDIIVSSEGVPYVLEVNTIPGFTETSLFPQAAREAGIEFPELCLKLLDLAKARFQEKAAGR